MAVVGRFRIEHRHSRKPNEVYTSVYNEILVGFFLYR